MALRREVVHLVRLHFLYDADKIAGIAQIAMTQYKMSRAGMRALREMVTAACVKERSAAFDTAHLIALVRQKFCQIYSSMASDAR